MIRSPNEKVLSQTQSQAVCENETADSFILLLYIAAGPTKVVGSSRQFQTCCLTAPIPALGGFECNRRGKYKETLVFFRQVDGARDAVDTLDAAGAAGVAAACGAGPAACV